MKKTKKIKAIECLHQWKLSTISERQMGEDIIVFESFYCKECGKGGSCARNINICPDKKYIVENSEEILFSKKVWYKKIFSF